MSFEDDAYWESEYTDRSPARYAVSRQQAPPVDELAVRRKRRQGRYRRPPRRAGGTQKGFDSERPSWLDDPDFVPTDVSEPDMAGGHGTAVLDFNRPELGAAFDAPRRNAPHVEDDDWDDEIDEPYDHRVGMDRRSTAQPPIISQAGPPPAPKKADPTPAPRVLSGRARVTPTPVTSATTIAPPAIGTAPASPASAATAPVSSAAAAAPVSYQPAPPGGTRPPLQRAPADIAPPPDTLDQSTPDTQPHRHAGDDEASGWFATRPSGPAATEGADPAVPAPANAPHPGSQPAAPLAPEDLRAVRWRLDGGTLREVVDDLDALRDLGGRLDGPLAEETNHIARAGLLSLRAEVYRLLGELGMAAAASRLALAHAESARDVHAIVIAQAELAHVLRLRGHYPEADRLLEAAAGSDASELLRSVVHEYAGRSCFDQGRHMEALDHFARAIRLGARDDLDLVERIDVCLEAVYIHVLRDGWGPYPRLRREILGAEEPSPTEPPPQ